MPSFCDSPCHALTRPVIPAKMGMMMETEVTACGFAIRMQPSTQEETGRMSAAYVAHSVLHAV